MEKPQNFPKVLTFVMIMVAFTLCLVGSLGYLSYGSNVETVALLNLPPGVIPNSIQLGYAIAVQLSNVLAIFPTIRIVEQALFGNRTGKYSLRIKWEKNIVRFVVVIAVGIVAFFGANDLDKFISLIGSICCCKCFFILFLRKKKIFMIMTDYIYLCIIIISHFLYFLTLLLLVYLFIIFIIYK